MALCNASAASTEQWVFIGGKPPSASAMAVLVIFSTSASGFPLTIVVIIDEVAIAAPHPRV